MSGERIPGRDCGGIDDRRKRRSLGIVCRTVAFAWAAVAFAAGSAWATPLDDYVAKPDRAFSYDKTPVREEIPGGAVYTYRMTSQRWLDRDRVDRPKWKHWVQITVPDECAYDLALLYIGEGNNEGSKAPRADPALGRVAVATKTILVNLRMVPNQPLRFAGETDERYRSTGRSEDEILAYAWDKFLVEGDPEWLPRLPMTKAAIRAMDLAQNEFASIRDFLVVGASKRGWTAWTTAAVDPRVKAVAPAVIDVLSVAESLDNHFAAYGYWAPAIANYKDMDILSRLHTAEFRALQAVVDPLTYKDRLTMPKYIVNSAGDQFFPPDSSKFYFDQLPGEKYLRYLANTDHGLSMEAYFNVASFHHAVAAGTPRPKFTWTREDDGALVVRCDTAPKQVLLWQAHNPDGRDFRMEAIGKAWTSSIAPGDGKGNYRVEPDFETAGWTAFFLEMEFDNPGFSFPFKFTTSVSIVPDTYPSAAQSAN